jgi:hypothetical protein
VSLSEQSWGLCVGRCEWLEGIIVVLAGRCDESVHFNELLQVHDDVGKLRGLHPIPPAFYSYDESNEEAVVRREQQYRQSVFSQIVMSCDEPLPPQVREPVFLGNRTFSVLEYNVTIRSAQLEMKYVPCAMKQKDELRAMILRSEARDYVEELSGHQFDDLTINLSEMFPICWGSKKQLHHGIWAFRDSFENGRIYCGEHTPQPARGQQLFFAQCGTFEMPFAILESCDQGRSVVKGPRIERAIEGN